MPNTDSIAMRQNRPTRVKSLTLSLDEQVQDFLDGRGSLPLYDALDGASSDKLLPRRLGTGKGKRA